MLKTRSLRRYEMRRVSVTTSDATGVRGTLDRAYPDHLLLTGAQFMRATSQGADFVDAGGSVVVPLASVLAIAVEPAA